MLRDFAQADAWLRALRACSAQRDYMRACCTDCLPLESSSLMLRAATWTISSLPCTLHCVPKCLQGGWSTAGGSHCTALAQSNSGPRRPEARAARPADLTSVIRAMTSRISGLTGSAARRDANRNSTAAGQGNSLADATRPPMGGATGATGLHNNWCGQASA